MFDKYYMREGNSTHTHKHNVNVQENKAPTDESIKILNEMQEKARMNLIKHFEIEDNSLNGQIFLHQEPMTRQYIFSTRFTLNGIEYYAEKKIKDYKLMAEDYPFELFYTELCGAITYELFGKNKHKAFNLFREVNL